MSPVKTVVVVGGVAGGASAAARLRRLDESIEIIVLERSGYVSFANCGLPYHLSSTIDDRSDLLLQTPESLNARFRLDVRVRQEVVGIDREAQLIQVRDLDSGDELYEIKYGALILSPGAAPIVPPIPGADLGLVLRDIEDLDRMMEHLHQAKTAVVIGGGFIGLEAAENLVESGIEVTLVEQGAQVLAPLDPEMATPLANEIAAHGVCVELGRTVTEIMPGKVLLDDGRVIPADAVVMSIGVRPDSRLARDAGLVVGKLGGIVVDENLQTSDPHIWAVGDATEKRDIHSGEAVLTPLANVANRQGRRAADAIMGRVRPVLPSQGTAIVKVFGMVAATTGWNEKRLVASGRPYLAIHSHPTDHASYYPGAEKMALKLLVDPNNGSILGAQAVGRGGVDKRIDVIATAMRAGLSATDLIDLELAYAPPFGSAKDPINQLGYVAENRLSGVTDSADWSEVESLQSDGWTIVDVRSDEEFESGSIPGSVHIPLDDLRMRGSELAGSKVVVYCAAGQRSHVAARYLRSQGIEVRNLDGGWSTWQDRPVAYTNASPGVAGATPSGVGTARLSMIDPPSTGTLTPVM